jgi:hypothetical protein
MLPYSKIQGGTLTATASTAQDIVISSMNPPDFFFMKNITGWGLSSPGAVRDIEFWWERSMAQGTARGIQATNATPQVMTTLLLASDGISTYSTANPPTFAPLAMTGIDATTYVVLMPSTAGLNVGDVVRLYNVAGMQEISGYIFQITAVTANVSITLGYMATAQSAVHSITVNGTTGFVQKIIPNRFYPTKNRIVAITKASAGSAKIYFALPNDFTPGEKIDVRIPSQFGMVQLQSSPGSPQPRVLVSTNTATESSVTIDVDTSGFSAFTFPSSVTAAAGVSPAIAVPSSSGVVPLVGAPLNGLNTPQQPPGTNLRDSFDNRNVYVIHLGGTIFANSLTNDVWMWQALRYDEYNGQ